MSNILCVIVEISRLSDLWKEALREDVKRQTGKVQTKVKHAIRQLRQHAALMGSWNEITIKNNQHNLCILR